MNAMEIYDAGKKECPCNGSGWCSAVKELCAFENCPVPYWAKIIVELGRAAKAERKKKGGG